MTALRSFLDEVRGARPASVAPIDWEKRIWQFQSELDRLSVEAADDDPDAVKLLAEISTIVQRDDLDLPSKGLEITNAIRAVWWEQRRAVAAAA